METVEVTASDTEARMAADDSAQNNTGGDDDDGEDAPMHVSHFKNTEAHSALVRYGVPLWTLATLVLLINADIGSGVSADFLLTEDGEIVQEDSLLVASIFSSVKELWHNGTYPLAILIAVTSIAWPYVKLLLSFYAWFMPYRIPRRREFLVEALDALGKWSFVDIIVLVEIMVAFRQSIIIAEGAYVEIVVRAQWGFYGFVLATMMSLMSTHIILHFHRHLHYHNKDKIVMEEQASPEQTIENDSKKETENNADTSPGLNVSGAVKGMALVAVLVSIGLYIAGCVVDIYEVNNARGEAAQDITVYSIVSVGQDIPESSFEEKDIGNRFIQIMWFFLGVAMPLWCSFLFGILYLVPLSREWMERIFVMGEIAFAWSCAEVLLVSTIFSVLQMPTFGDGLIESGCSQCYVDTAILPPFALLCVATVANVTTNVWLYRKAHDLVYAS